MTNSHPCNWLPQQRSLARLPCPSATPHKDPSTHISVPPHREQQASTHLRWSKRLPPANLRGPQARGTTILHATVGEPHCFLELLVVVLVFGSPPPPPPLHSVQRVSTIAVNQVWGDQNYRPQSPGGIYQDSLKGEGSPQGYSQTQSTRPRKYPYPEYPSIQQATGKMGKMGKMSENGGKRGKMGKNGGKWGKMEKNGGKWEVVTNTSWKMYENIPTRKKNGGKWCRNGGQMGEKWDTGRSHFPHFS